MLPWVDVHRESALIRHLKLGRVFSRCVVAIGGGSVLKTLPLLNALMSTEATLTEG